jgi:hypothetical protein
MTEEEFDTMIRSLKQWQGFVGADAAVVILYRFDGENVGTYCRGFFDQDAAEAMVEAGQAALEDLPDMIVATDIARLQ